MFRAMGPCAQLFPRAAPAVDRRASCRVRKPGSDVDATFGSTKEFKEAVVGWHEDVMEFLLNAGADVAIKTAGSTAIDQAERRGYEHLTKLFNAHGA